MQKIIVAIFLAMAIIHPSTATATARNPIDARNTACLIAAAWNEARGRTSSEIVGVMHVVLNRVRHPAFKESTICAVVLAPGQFSMSAPIRQMVIKAKNTGVVAVNLKQPEDRKAFQRISAIAYIVQDGHSEDPTHGATHFFSPKLRIILGLSRLPNWAKKLLKTAVIGEFQFHRQT